MKTECKVPIRESHLFFPKQQQAIASNKNVGIVIAVLFFVTIISVTLTSVFFIQSSREFNELKREVVLLKSALEVLQKDVEEYRNETTSIKSVEFPNVEKYFPQLLHAGDYGDSDGEDYLDFYDDLYEDGDYSNSPPLENVDNATLPPRLKRSIIGYTQDKINTEGNANESGDNSLKKHYFSTQSSYPYPYHQDNTQSTPAPREIYSRRFHVSADQRYRHNMRSSMRSGDYQSQENPEVEFTVINDRHRPRRLELDERQIRTGRMRPLPVAHFSGDTSKYVLGQHDNFRGNGHLRHLQRTYVDWAKTSWFDTLGMNQYFSLNDGLLTVTDAGLYLIYAQIYYFDEHDTNGFRVYRNENDSLLQCTMTSVGRNMKGNTCFTLGVEYLNENDKISLVDLSESRYSLFEPGKSFFGIIKLGDVKIK